MVLAFLGIGIFLSVITYRLYSEPIYVTNITTIVIENNTIVNVTSTINTTGDKKLSIPFLDGEDIGAKVVS